MLILSKQTLLYIYGKTTGIVDEKDVQNNLFNGGRNQTFYFQNKKTKLTLLTNG